MESHSSTARCECVKREELEGSGREGDGGAGQRRGREREREGREKGKEEWMTGR